MMNQLPPAKRVGEVSIDNLIGNQGQPQAYQICNMICSKYRVDWRTPGTLAQ